jgi:hypothetical protein
MKIKETIDILEDLKVSCYNHLMNVSEKDIIESKRFNMRVEALNNAIHCLHIILDSYGE